MKKRLNVLEIAAELRIPSSGPRSVGAVATVIMSHYFDSKFSGGWALKRAAVRSIMFRL